MSRARKLLLIVPGALLLAAVVFSLIAHTLVSRGDHELVREQIGAAALAATGFELEISGPLDLPYGLMPTGIFRDIRLRNPNAGSDEPVIIANELRITLAALPLLAGELRVQAVSLAGVQLALEIDSEGRANWITGVSAGDGTVTVDLPSLRAVRLQDINVAIVNHRSGLALDARIDSLTMTSPITNRFIDYSLAAEIAGASLALDGRFGPEADILAGRRFTVELGGSLDGIGVDATVELGPIPQDRIADIAADARVEFSGSDLAYFRDRLGWPVPDTDRFEFAGVVKRDGRGIDASEIAGSAVWNGHEFTVAGSIADLLGWTGFELDVRLVGRDLSGLSHLYDLDWLPASESYDVKGSLTGDWPALAIGDGELELAHGDVTLDAAGSIADLDALRDFDVDAAVYGGDLAGLADWVDVPSVPSSAFRLEGSLGGDWPALAMQDGTFSAERDGISITAVGRADSIVTPGALDFTLTSSGTNLADVPELAKFGPPATDAFEFEGRFRGPPADLAIDDIGFRLDVGAHQIDIAGEVESIEGLKGIDVRVAAKGTNLNELNDLLTIALPMTHDYDMAFRLDGDLEYLRASDIVVDGAMPGMTGSFRGEIGKAISFHDIDLTASLTIDSFDGIDVYRGPELPAGISIDLDGRLTGSFPRLALQEMSLKTGDSYVTGSANLAFGERLHIESSLSSGLLDLRPFLVAAREKAEAALDARHDASRVFSNERLDHSYLDGYDARFVLDDLELLWSDGRARVEHATVALEEGSLSIDPMQIRRNETTFDGHFSLQRDAGNQIHADLDIEHVDLATLMSDLGLEEGYEGTLDVVLDLDAAGSSVAELMAGLDGEVSIFVSEARIHDVSLALRTTDVLLGFLPWLEQTEELVITCGISHLAANAGELNARLLYIDGKQLRMIGAGSVDLASEQLDLRLAPRPRGTGVLAHNIDLLVRGPLAEPDVSRTGASKALATSYGKYALLGPVGLLVPSGASKKHPCVGSLQEYRAQQE